VIVEGMLAQKPVIATRAGGATEIIRDEVDGILVSPGSVSEMRAALERLQNDPALRRQIAEAGKQRALQAYSLDTSIRGTAAALAYVRGSSPESPLDDAVP
jgi:glycosyltransferase involved in cell wall biosynthesis